MPAQHHQRLPRPHPPPSSSSFNRDPDPFSDYAAYAPAHVPYRDPTSKPPPAHSARIAKQAALSEQPSSHPVPAYRDRMTDVARDSSRAMDPPQTRTRMHRSQTSIPNATPPSSGRPSHSSRRSHSQDSVIQQAVAVEKARNTGGPTRPTPKSKRSAHADVIDRLDRSGVGVGVFHHDSPFDACAPSRNKHRTKAPMLAWTGGAHPEDQAVAAKYAARDTRNNDSPYPTPRSPAYEPPAVEYAKPKKQVDAIAEAWGIHEPEPYEEFFAGSGNRSGFNSRNASSQAVGNGSGTPNSRRSRDGEANSTPQTARRANANANLNGGRRAAGTGPPPPKPIFAGEEYVDGPPSPSDGFSPGGAPKRSKSLMNRFRRMRENPNVPAGGAYDSYEALGSSPPSSAPGRVGARPTHRANNSLFGVGGAGGRNGNGRGANGESISPLSDNSDFVHVNFEDGANTQKDLPATPGSPADPESLEYFSASTSSGAGANGSTTPGAGLGRKTSLIKKVKGAIRAGRSVERAR